jgi:hypothetical protein
MAEHPQAFCLCSPQLSTFSLSTHENRIRLTASIRFEIIIQCDNWRLILIRTPINPTLFQRQAIFTKFIHLLKAVLADGQTGYVSAVPFLYYFLERAEGSVIDAECSGEVHVGPVDKLWEQK